MPAPAHMNLGNPAPAAGLVWPIAANGFKFTGLGGRGPRGGYVFFGGDAATRDCGCASEETWYVVGDWDDGCTICDCAEKSFWSVYSKKIPGFPVSW